MTRLPQRPLTRTALDRAQCDTPDCHETHGALFLNSLCHPRQGVEVSYVVGSGVLDVRCLVCKLPVVRVAVARSLVVP